MSKPSKRQPEYQWFIEVLRRRGMTIGRLAETLRTNTGSRTYWNEVLAGRESGLRLWRVLREAPTEEEVALHPCVYRG